MMARKGWVLYRCPSSQVSLSRITASTALTIRQPCDSQTVLSTRISSDALPQMLLIGNCRTVISVFTAAPKLRRPLRALFIQYTTVISNPLFPAAVIAVLKSILQNGQRVRTMVVGVGWRVVDVEGEGEGEASGRPLFESADLLVGYSTYKEGCIQFLY